MMIKGVYKIVDIFPIKSIDISIDIMEDVQMNSATYNGNMSFS